MNGTLVGAVFVACAAYGCGGGADAPPPLDTSQSKLVTNLSIPTPTPRLSGETNAQIGNVALVPGRSTPVEAMAIKPVSGSSSEKGSFSGNLAAQIEGRSAGQQ